MILITFKYGQGLGNQLWLLFSALSIAAKYKKKLVIENYKFFIGKNFIKLKNIIIFNNKHNFQDFEYENYFEPLFYAPKLNSYISLYDHKIKNLNFNKNLKLYGLFQSEKYILFNKKYFLENYISIPGSKLKLDNNLCVLNIRGGEYKRHHNLILPKNYWENAMQLIKKKNPNIKFLIVTDDKIYAKRLFPNLPIISKSISECFIKLQNVKYLILSNSSFSFFPIFFSNFDKNIIVAPYLWARFNNKQKLWCSPSNYYKNWIWIDIKGEIVNKKSCEIAVNKTINYVLNSLKNIAEEYHLKENSNIAILIIKFKYFLKRVLRYFFPYVF